MTLPSYSAYRDSGVEWLGAVPAHWTVKRLAHYFDERRTKVSDKDYPPLSVTKSGIVPQLETAAKTDDGDNRKLVLAGDFVINSRSDRKGSSGLSPLDGSVSLINTVLEPASAIDGRFAHHLLRSTSFQEEFYRYGKGIVADLWSTNFSEMRNILLAVPPTDEQAAIAAFLDYETAKIDALADQQRLLIKLLKEKRRAVISHAITHGLHPGVPMKDSGVESLGVIPAHWEVVQVRRLISRIEQGWSPECESRPAEAGEWGVLKTGCVNGGTFRAEENKALPRDLDPIPAYEVRPGDVLVSRANGTPELVGSTAYVSDAPKQLMISDKIFRIRFRPGVHPPWFAKLFNSHAIRTQIIQAISGADGLANNLPQAELKAFICPLPPIAEQRAIESHINFHTSRFDHLIVHARDAIGLLNERRAALISAAVTGKIDVREAATQRAEAA